MKTRYLRPCLDVMTFDENDVIATSIVQNFKNDEDELLIDNGLTAYNAPGSGAGERSSQ